MIKFKIFLILLAIIAIIATFYTPSAILSISIYGYKDTASPYNTDWNGTTRLLLELDKFSDTDIIIVNSDKELVSELERSGLLLLIAPDYSLGFEIYNEIENLYRKGYINIAVFDENTTLNDLLIRFNIRISGKAILELVNKTDPYYPLATIVDLNNTVYYFMLNYGSSIHVGSGLSNVKVISTSYGLLDFNDNGQQDDYIVDNFTVGVLINNSNNYILVFGDSYPLINSGLGSNLTVSRVLIDYIVFLARGKNSRIIIPNYLYKQSLIGKERGLFHPSILFLLLAIDLKNIDIFLTSVLTRNPLTVLLFLITIISILVFNRMFKYLFGIKSTFEYRLSRVKRYYFIVGSSVTKDLWSREVISGLEKDLVLKYWSILLTTYRVVRNIDLENVLNNNDYILLTRMGFSRDQVKRLVWMKHIVDKVLNKKKLPIVFSWRSVVSDFIIYLEEFLNLLGYTIMNKGGFRNVSSIIK